MGLPFFTTSGVNGFFLQMSVPQGCNDSTSRNLQLLQLPGMAGVACGFISPMEFSAGHRLGQISSALTKLFYDFAAVYYCFAGNH